MKTPEQMAEECVRDNTSGNETYEHGLRTGFLVGYQAAKDEILSKGMQGYITEIRNDAWCTAMQLGQQSQWISVKERLPEHNIPVLVFDTLANTIELMSWDKIMEAFGTEDAYFVELNEASHWMPLPEAPKGEG